MTELFGTWDVTGFPNFIENFALELSDMPDNRIEGRWQFRVHGIRNVYDVTGKRNDNRIQIDAGLKMTSTKDDPFITAMSVSGEIVDDNTIRGTGVYYIKGDKNTIELTITRKS